MHLHQPYCLGKFFSFNLSFSFEKICSVDLCCSLMYEADIKLDFRLSDRGRLRLNTKVIYEIDLIICLIMACFAIEKCLPTLYFYLFQQFIEHLFSSLPFSICWGRGERCVVSFLVRISISVSLTLFLPHFLDNERWCLNLVPYFIESKILSTARWVIFLFTTKKEKVVLLKL